MTDVPRRQAGLTIVEIMVTLAVAAVLIGLALPAFNGFLAQRALRSDTNAFILAVQLARSEATRRNANTSVEARDDSDSDNEWGPGWCVVEGNGGAGCGVNLQVFPGMTRATLDGPVSTLTFNARGLLVPNTERTFDLCDNDEDVDPGRRIVVSVIGRVTATDLDCHP
jgi:type IV fimbrial biogenesis protein FimT